MSSLQYKTPDWPAAFRCTYLPSLFYNALAVVRFIAFYEIVFMVYFRPRLVLFLRVMSCPS